MHPKYAVVWATLVSLLLIPACSLRSPPAAVIVTCDDFARAASPNSTAALLNTEVTVAVGTPFTVTLCSNPSTGYQWEPPRVADQSLVQQVDHQVTPAPAGGVGAPGTETWTFKALKPGGTVISFAYSRPWVGGEKGSWQLRLKVNAG